MFLQFQIRPNNNVRLHPESVWHMIDTFLQTYDLSEVRDLFLVEKHLFLKGLKNAIHLVFIVFYGISNLIEGLYVFAITD